MTTPSLTHLRAGVIGTGFIGPVHIENLRRIGAQVTAICGSTKSARATAEKWGIPEVFGDYDIAALLRSPNVDVIHITSPNKVHVDQSLAALAAECGVEPRILRTVDETNNQQKHVLFRKILEYFGGDLTDRTIAVWGLSFKPRTDDIREAPALVLIHSLLEAGAVVKVHDPVALENVRREIGDRITYCDHHYDACEGADAIAIVTEWNEFRNPDFDYIKLKMKTPVVFDGRNLYDRTKMASRGFYYSGIGLSALPDSDRR